MIYRAIILVSLTAAILFVGGLATYSSPQIADARYAPEQLSAKKRALNLARVSA